MRLRELLIFVDEQLKKAGVVEHFLDAQLLVGECLHKNKAQLILGADQEIERFECTEIFRNLERRKKREPIAYILGEREFWSMPFKVSPAVLIPRQETEFLLDRVLTLSDPAHLQRGLLLDLCCGSGVIATVLAKEKNCNVIASDISLAALKIARENVARHGMSDKVMLLAASLFSSFKKRPSFSLIVSNPPYVSSHDINNSIEPEVADFEPRLALDGGADGLTYIKQIRQEIPSYLRAGGELFMEIGSDQGAVVVELFSRPFGDSPGFKKIDILQDYSGRDRVLYAQLK